MPIDPALALGAAAAPVRPATASGAAGRVLVAGAVGRLGEAVLSTLLGRGGHAEVIAHAEQPIAIGVRGLGLAVGEAWPAIDEAVLVVTEHDEAGRPQRSFFGRDVAFAALPADALPVAARRAVAAGARRLVVVHPLPAWQQLSAFHRGLAGEAELALAALPLQALVVMRPVARGGPAAGGWLQRFVRAYLSVQLLMLPRSLPALTSEAIARVVVEQLEQAPDGVTVLGAEAIGERSQAMADARRARVAGAAAARPPATPTP